jgi:hypothetical protein
MSDVVGVVPDSTSQLCANWAALASALSLKREKGGTP